MLDNFLYDVPFHLKIKFSIFKEQSLTCPPFSPMTKSISFILANIATDATMHKLWKSYCKKYNYAKSIQFTDNIEILYKIIEQMNKIKIYQPS